MFICNLFSQEKIIKKYDNGNILFEGFIVNNILDSIYKEYYPNGVLKTQGYYKNCQFKTNNRVVILSSCGSGIREDTIKSGKLNGEWKEYYESGKLKNISNYFCGLQHGNFIYYSENGTIESVDFYTTNRKILSQEYNDNQTLSEINYYDEKWIKNKNYKTIRSIEFFNNGNYKSEIITEEKENGYEYEIEKEYYLNGFLKLENVLINGDKHGICYEYYENGNVKQVGFFEYDKPVYVQLFYNEDGTTDKLERWKKGNLIFTEKNFDPKKAFKYKVKKYKD